MVPKLVALLVALDIALNFRAPIQGPWNLSLPMPPTARATVLRFDCGTDVSPLAPGYQRVTARTVYSGQGRFGWVGEDVPRKSFHRANISPLVVWKHNPAPTTVDGVASAHDLIFRVDVPSGHYRVEVLLGDMGGRVPAGQGRFLDTGRRGESSGGPGGPLYSMAVESNGALIARNLEARTFPHRGLVAAKELIDDLPGAGLSPEAHVRLGNYMRVVFDQQVRDGKLLLRFHGEQSRYDQALVKLRARNDPVALRQQLYTAGGPFKRNSVLSIVVRPAVAQPFVEHMGKLRVAAEEDPRLEQFAKAFNRGRFREARELTQRMPQGNFAQRHARVLARMWLVGHPNHWDERELVAGTTEEITAAQRDASRAEREQLRSLRDMLLDFQRGVMNFDQRTRDGQDLIGCMNRAEGYFCRALPGEPFFWKSQLYRARIWYSMDPNRRAQLWRRARELIENLARAYPNNRWADYYLRQNTRGWPLVDYRTRTRGAPRWARELHAYYNRMLDLCQWWIDHRQDPRTGAIGGEWGDDVELMPLLAYMGFVCPDAAPRVLAGSLRFGDGVWSRSGIVDTFNGFFHITSDAEHAAEFTGNVLGMMMHLRPGDPEYVERSLKTAKLMRDIWMGRNARGQRLFRSSYLGAFHVPAGTEHVDAAICGRALLPALYVVELNRNPEIARLITEYADTLLELAQSTDKGKPKWVLPGPVVYGTGELGHTGSNQWWMAPPGPFQGMFSFPRYHAFRHQILTTAWRLTGESAYLEPIRREAGIVTQSTDDDRATAGSRAWVAGQLRRMGVASLWNDLKGELATSGPGERGVLLDKDVVADEARRLSETARQRWPMMTDDATMTDRVAFRGCINPVLWYSGARLTTQQIQPAVSYEGPGRDFAALVLQHNASYIKLLYYGFHHEPRAVRIRFWELVPHATYRLRGGVDSDNDNTIDQPVVSRDVKLREPSDAVDLVLPPRQTIVLEITSTSPGKLPEQVIDPAIAARDIHYDPRGHLLVDVHNLGNQPAEEVSVTFYEGHASRARRLLGRTIVSHIDPPNQLVPQVVRTGMEWRPTADEHEITVVLDEEDKLAELFERNNEARIVLRRDATRKSTARLEPIPLD